jgi:hypothetical protein
LIIKRTTPKALRTLRFENNTKGIDYRKAKNIKSYIRIIDKNTRVHGGTPKPRAKTTCNVQKPHVDWTYIYISHIFLCKILHLCGKKHIYLLQGFFFI